MFANLAERIDSRRITRPEAEPIILDRHRIYVLPTRSGIILSIILCVTLFASMNYNNSMGYAFTFLLVGIAIISMIHTHKNLSRIMIRSGHTAPVFAGKTIHFELSLSTQKQKEKLSIEGRNEFGSEITDIHPHESAVLHIRQPTTRRGLLSLKRFKMCTEYPLGIVHAWSWVQPDITCIVYPQPEVQAPPIKFYDANASHQSRTANDNDDFNGFRDYSSGDSPKHIAWKQYSTRDILLTKQFSSGSTESHWLDWESVSELSVEAGVSRLCQWVLECHKQDLRFGLRLRSNRVAPSRGEQHMHDCLKALALFTPEP